MKKVLVDTTIWIDAFNDVEKETSKVLIELIESDQKVFIAPVILQEILQGFNKEKDFESAKDYLSGFELVGLDDAFNDSVESARLYRTCRKKGSSIRKSNDCLIAWLAIKNELELFHNDKDFSEIAKHTKLKVFSY